MKIKIKRFFCVILSCAILLQSFALSYRRAKATELIIGGELAAEAAGAAGLTLGTGGVGLLLLLGGLGVTVAWENRDEIKDTVVATGNKVKEDFENFCDKAGTTIQSAQAEYDDFMDKLGRGLCDTRNKFYDMFKQFVGEISKNGESESEESGLKVVSHSASEITISGAGTYPVCRYEDGSYEYLCIKKVEAGGKEITPCVKFTLWSTGYAINANVDLGDLRGSGDYMWFGWGTSPSEAESNVIRNRITYGKDTSVARQLAISTCVWNIITGGLKVNSKPAYSGYTFPQVHPNYGNTSTWDVSDTDPFNISRPHDGIGRDIPITKPIEDVPDKPVLNPETGQYEWTNTWDKVISGDIPIGDLIDVGVVELPDEADDTPGKLWVNGEEMDIPIEDVLPVPRETVEPTEEPKPTEEPNEETKKIRNKMVRPNLKSLFPFCIPFDLYRILSLLDAEPKAPEFSWNFIVGFNGTKPRYQTVRFRFNDFDSVAKVLRNMEKILFIVGLMMITRDKMLKS